MLFKSHKEGFEDGKQLRDFIYVKDVVKVIGWMMEQAKEIVNNRNADSKAATNLSSGIYNLGTGEARTFEDLVKATFSGLDLEPEFNLLICQMI
jgi:ADP-L-glycero-D-manno-heptose 6-epimerase